MARKDTKASIPPEGALRASAAKALRNGSGLLEDARLLFEAKRYARATALAILSEEEFLKAFLLDNAALQGNWDNARYAALFKHGIKLGLAEGLQETMRLLEPDRNSAAWLRGRVADYGLRLPSEEQMGSIADRVRNLAVKNQRNFTKQNAMYVGIGPDGVATSVPEDLSEIDALAALLSAEKMAEAAGRQTMAYPAVTLGLPIPRR